MSEEESKNVEDSQQSQDAPVEQESTNPDETAAAGAEDLETAPEPEKEAPSTESETPEAEGAVEEVAETAGETPEIAADQDQEAIETETAAEPNVQPLKIPQQEEAPLDSSAEAGELAFADERIQRILDIEMPVNVSFGSTRRPLSEVLKLGPGALLELDRVADEPVVLKVNNKIFAKGEIVDVDGYYGVQITEISSAAQRIASLGD